MMLGAVSILAVAMHDRHVSRKKNTEAGLKRSTPNHGSYCATWARLATTRISLRHYLRAAGVAAIDRRARAYGAAIVATIEDQPAHAWSVAASRSLPPQLHCTVGGSPCRQVRSHRGASSRLAAFRPRSRRWAQAANYSSSRPPSRPPGRLTQPSATRLTARPKAAMLEATGREAQR